MASIEYFRPASLNEALSLLQKHGEGAVPVAGATDVWVNLRSKKLQPKALVSVRAIEELIVLGRDATSFVVGAATPHAALEDSDWVGEFFPALRRACGSVGSRQVRNVGTVGGNICNAAPSADSAIPLLLYDAVCTLYDTRGPREVPVDRFFQGPGKTVLAQGELLTEIRIPLPPNRTFSGYWKHTRRKAMELPLLGVGALVTLAEDGETVTKARIALGVAGPVPVRVRRAEEALEGKKASLEVFQEAARIAAEDAQVRDSWRGKAWYRREMIRVLIPRVLTEAGALNR